MDEVFALDEAGKNRKALARLYDHIDIVMYGASEEHGCPWIDKFLAEFPWERKPSIGILIGVLTITCNGSHMLRGYQPFCKRVRDYITTNHPDRNVEALVRGFED